MNSNIKAFEYYNLQLNIFLGDIYEDKDVGNQGIMGIWKLFLFSCK